MNNRCWLWLLLMAFSLTPQTITAQPSFARSSLAKRSHIDLPGGPDANTGQEAMADRLKELHELHQLQDQVQGLLKDPAFLDQLKKIPERDLQRLREKILHGNGLKQDKNWNNLLDRAASLGKLNNQQIDRLRRWAERSEGNEAESNASPAPAEGIPPSSYTPPPGGPPVPPWLPSPTPPPEASFWERMQKKSTDWVKEHMDDLSGDLLNALDDVAGSDEGAPLADLMRTLKTPDFSGASFAEPANELSDYLPKVGELLHRQRGAWDDMRSMFRQAHVPSLPGLGGPSLSSLPAAPSMGDEDWGGPVLMLAALGLVLLLVWKLGSWSELRRLRGERDAWQLGAWPVQPAAVSTRRDLILAFEYLALLCLGVQASTRHHRELAERLAGQDSTDPARRRQAAELLAWRYEQARYAPADESLSPDELTEARHALCFLAGVTAP